MKKRLRQVSTKVHVCLLFFYPISQKKIIKNILKSTTDFDASSVQFRCAYSKRGVFRLDRKLEPISKNGIYQTASDCDIFNEIDWEWTQIFNFIGITFCLFPFFLLLWFEHFKCQFLSHAMGRKMGKFKCYFNSCFLFFHFFFFISVYNNSIDIRTFIQAEVIQVCEIWVKHFKCFFFVLQIIIKKY